MLVNFLFGFAGVMLFLFVFWRRLKDDYSSEMVFQIGTSILIGMGLGLSIAKIFFPSWFFWLALLGYVLGTIAVVFRFKLRFFEILEATIMAGMPFISLLFFKDSITKYSLSSFIAFTASLVLIFLAYWFDVSYKKFTWYKSGRIGFAGLMASIIFFLTRAVIAIIGITVVSLVGKFEAILSITVALVSVGLLIYLAKQE